MGNLNMLKERIPQACLTKGCYPGCHTSSIGSQESHLSSTLLVCIYILTRMAGGHVDHSLRPKTRPYFVPESDLKLTILK